MSESIAAEAVEPLPSCDICSCEIEEGEGVDHHGVLCCRDCVSTCEGCDNTVPSDEIYEAYTSPYGRARTGYNNTRCLCDECSYSCADCGNRFDNDTDNNNNTSDDRICGRCAESYTSCEDCSETIHSDDGHVSHDGDRTLCHDCWRNQEDDEERNLHHHDYKPTPSFLKSPKDTLSPRLFLGIELEVDHTSRRDRSDDIDSAKIDSSVFYCKEDGSLCRGFEIVSHPATWEYWKGVDFGFIPNLIEMGYKSYDTTTCGMHVHISRKFMSSFDTFKLLAFFKQNQDFIFKVSRRKEENLRQWAKIDGSQVGSLAQKVKHGASDRYEALNLTNRNTIEFRIFRGTLEKNSLMRNLAFVVALTHFVKTCPLSDLSATSFCLWIAQKGTGVLGKAECARLLRWVNSLLPGTVHTPEALPEPKPMTPPRS